MGNDNSTPESPSSSAEGIDTNPFSSPRPSDRKFSRKYTHISDQYTSLEQVQQSLSKAGLESSNLIIGIDFTKSNEWTGKNSFNGRSLHAIGDAPNPYEQAISIIGRTLSAFDEDNLIPCFCFGDASTHDQYVFSFYPDHRPCSGFTEALTRYRAITPHVRLSGPTSFAPIIEAAIQIVEDSGGQYHVLVIIADGQVTRSVDTEAGRLSSQEKSTIDAIVTASNYALSIILVGVGDGPWDMMQQFDDNIPARGFDNFQFVNFSEIMAKHMPVAQKEALFALSALMEIPPQFRAALELGALGEKTGMATSKAPLLPPQGVLQADAVGFGYPHSTNLPVGYSTSTHGAFSTSSSSAVLEPSSTGQECPICLTEKKDLAFGCGHQTCRECGKDLVNCPICRQKISAKIRLY
ncbi:hypothetical protein O6H91_06G133000 [Diphasiastrum complanatum]|uniref:Uncharacterized protein n=1 Tax=Diphasiastrum complanatum TaxID=34168 RepID=A0ACC2DJ97_DIPCM|nr:hypothetical protein O6H91_06G133000 [Diphasiastrum complanatum]